MPYYDTQGNAYACTRTNAWVTEHDFEEAHRVEEEGGPWDVVRRSGCTQEAVDISGGGESSSKAGNNKQ